MLSRLAMRWITRTSALLLGLFIGPLVMFATGQAEGGDWRTASREPVGLAPNPATTDEAIIQVYAARAYSWRGAFGVHTWVAVKPTAAKEYRTYEVLGWRAYRGGRALSIRDDRPDRRWYGNPPQVLAEIRASDVPELNVDALIERIDAAAQSYPYADTYTLWPGPNSNTFTAWIARAVPELRLDLPPTAIGKDWLGEDRLVAATPSGTGYQLSLYGLAGVLIGVEEGFEVNLAGLTFGVDPLDLALKLPGIGRIGVPRAERPAETW